MNSSDLKSLIERLSKISYEVVILIIKSFPFDSYKVNFGLF